MDVVGLTGSAQTARSLRSIPVILKISGRFVAEQDSLNGSILGPDAMPGTPEFDLFVKEVSREMTTKAGQKCTAIRRIIAPVDQVQAVIDAVSAQLDKIVIGDPQLDTTGMGPLVSAGQKRDVLAKAAIIGQEAACVYGNPEQIAVDGADAEKGAFGPPMLFHCPDPDLSIINI